MQKETALFNEKTIKRLCSKTKITAKQKRAAKAWLEKLESDSLKRERAHYLEFNDSILRDLLGYDDVKFEEEDVEFSANDSTGKRGICFEVKGTKTKDLFAKQPRGKKEHETPVKQLWDYMSKDATPFGIITNYRTFILFDYLKGQSKYHQFDFAEIKNNNDKLKEFISIFSKDSILEKKFVEELYKQSVIEEKEFTKEFYKLFHETRLMLIEEFKANEELADPIKTPIHFAQLYLNRLMFILFAEDTGKLPPRVFEERILKILKSEGLVSEHSRYVSDTIRDLFVSVDKGATTPDKIFGFNGGLFEAPIPNKIYFKDLRDKKFFKEVYQHSQLKKEIKLDEDSQKILNTQGDKLNPLIKNLLLMAAFDFKTEINVNILGHIFEQSITDIEALQEGDTSRRKKEGVYYTPEYITDYICRNTIIPQLSLKGAKTPRELVLEHSDNIEELEKKFREIKILDPACGSGAFLIKAVDVLLEIHKEIQLFKRDRGAYTAIKKGLKVKKDEGQLMLGKWVEEDEARNIIENNIFGVDINEESIEITKLSLFLKIARKNRKLINLSNNIKCGNSLIDDEEFAGEKAFKWEVEFRNIIGNGGFDIVIGNPPYVRVQHLNKLVADYLFSYYDTCSKKVDLSVAFLELGVRLLNNSGVAAFISSSQWTSTDYGQTVRDYMAKGKILKIVDFGTLPVFSGVSTYPAIFFLSSSEQSELLYSKISESSELNIESLSKISFKKIDYDLLDDRPWVLEGTDLRSLIDSKDITFNLSEHGHFFIGALTGCDKAFIVSDQIINEKKLERELLLPYANRGEEIEKYGVINPSSKMIYPYEPGEKGNSVLIPEKEFRDNYPNISAHLSDYKEILTERKDSRKFYARGSRWHCFLRPGRYEYITPEKLLIRGVAKNSCAGVLGKNSSFSGANCPGFICTSKEIDKNFILAIFNSRLISKYLRQVCPAKLQGYTRFNANNLNKIPIPLINFSTSKTERNNQLDSLKELYYLKKDNTIIDSLYSPSNVEANKGNSGRVHDFLVFLTENIIEMTNEKSEKINGFLSWLESYLNLKVDEMELKTKVIDFCESTATWEEYYEILKKSNNKTNVNIDDFEVFNAIKKAFDSSREKLIPLLDRIEENDDLIDQIVYKLYGLTDEEIMVVEENA